MANKAFDVSKFRKNLTKSITGMSSGFNDPTDWISTGNYALNYLISGDFHKGVPMGKVTVFAGESGAGKSYICAGNIVKAAQDQGIFVVLIDSENALDEAWLQALNVDTTPEKLLKLNMSMIDDVAKTISTFMSDYRETPEEDRPKVLFVIDSLGMLLTPTDVTQFEKGDMKGDMGRKPKALASLVRNTVNQIAPYPIGIVATNHTYASQDMFDPDDKISGGQGFIYASSIVVAIKKLKLKEDEAGNKVIDLFFRPLTRSDRISANAATNSGDALAISTRLLCQLAELENGSKAFALDDAPKLQRELPEKVLNELELFLFGMENQPELAEAKND